MEGGGSGNNSTPIIDKTRVLDVEPLRTLVPVFPSSSKAPPFGPYSSGFAPFYPFSAPQGSQATPDLNQQTHTTPAAPLRSFRATESNGDAFDGEYESYDGSTGSAKRRPKSSSQKRARKIQDLDFTLSVDENNFVVGVSLSERDDGNREVVHSIQMRFDALRRRLSQLEDAKESPAGIIRRADLKAGNILMTKQVRTNTRKRIGTVPGVEIGDIFFFRMEMCLLGLHAPSMEILQYLLMELWSNLAEAAAEAEAFSFFRKGALSLPTETLRVARICNDLLSIVKNLSIIQNCSYQMFGICLKNL